MILTHPASTTRRRSSSGYYPPTPPTCAPASLNTSTSSVSKHGEHTRRDSTLALKMALGRYSPTQRSPPTSPLAYPADEVSGGGKGGGNHSPMDDMAWSDKDPGVGAAYLTEHRSGYISFPEFEKFYRDCEAMQEERRGEIQT